MSILGNRLRQVIDTFEGAYDTFVHRDIHIININNYTTMDRTANELYDANQLVVYLTALSYAYDTLDFLYRNYEGYQCLTINQVQNYIAALDIDARESIED